MKRLVILLLLLPLAIPSFAALFARDLDGNFSNGHEGVYDDVLDITWLANANLASLERFGVESTEGVSFAANGVMNWRTAQAWLGAMNNHNGGEGWLGHSSWRLPMAKPVNGTDFNSNNTWDGSTDVGGWITAPVGGYNSNGQSANFIGSELAYHYYNNFEGLAPFSGIGFTVTETLPTPIVGLDNASDPNNYLNLFTNTGSPTSFYWTGTEHEPSYTESGGEFLFRFRTDSGVQDIRQWNNAFTVWAVHDGDIGAVALPPAAVLLGTSIGLLLTLKRRRASLAT